MPYVGELPLGEDFRPSGSSTNPAAAAFDGTDLWIGWAFGIYRAQLIRADDNNRLVALDDVNGNGASELAILDDEGRVSFYDGLSGDSLIDVTFDFDDTLNFRSAFQ